MTERQFLEKDTQVLGISVDSVPVQKAFCGSFGGVNYPVLSDFNPLGQVSKMYGVFNEERGNSRRSVFVIDKDGVVRFKHLYERGQLLDPAEILKEVESLE